LPEPRGAITPVFSRTGCTEVRIAAPSVAGRSSISGNETLAMTSASTAKSAPTASISHPATVP
jgi:hypothetical protein